MSPALEATAKQWIQDEVQKRSKPAHAPLGQSPPKLQLSPVSWVLPKLLRIVAQNAKQPVEALAPLIRTMLQEQAFATTGGDPCDCDQLQASIDETVSIMVQVLERVRKQQLVQT